MEIIDQQHVVERKVASTGRPVGATPARRQTRSSVASGTTVVTTPIAVKPNAPNSAVPSGAPTANAV